MHSVYEGGKKGDIFHLPESLLWETMILINYIPLKGKKHLISRLL